MNEIRIQDDFKPYLIEALLELGGEAEVENVVNRVRTILKRKGVEIPDIKLSDMRGSEPAWRNDIRWARKRLLQQDWAIRTSSKRGSWELNYSSTYTLKMVNQIIRERFVKRIPELPIKMRMLELDLPYSYYESQRVEVRLLIENSETGGFLAFFDEDAFLLPVGRIMDTIGSLRKQNEKSYANLAISVRIQTGESCAIQPLVCCKEPHFDSGFDRLSTHEKFRYPLSVLGILEDIALPLQKRGSSIVTMERPGRL